jgi:ribonuclease HI
VGSTIQQSELDSNFVFYSDGSCNKDSRKGGYGLVMVNKDVEVKSLAKRAEDTTVSRMELSGIIVCLKTILDKLDYFSKFPAIYIVSDSEYATLGVSERMVKWQKNGWRNTTGDVPNLDLWKIAFELHQHLARHKLPIQICWVKGHSKHKWNERVDQLADYKTPI